MNAPDDWKGASLIKRRPSKAEQIASGQSAVRPAVHKRKTEAGTNVSRSGIPWLGRIRASVS